MTDFVVVGGGIAGVSVAYELAAHGSVVLVEAERTLAVHTTGRSAAVYLPTYGGPVVRELTAASRARFEAFPDELGTPDLLSPRPMLWVAVDDDGEEHLPSIAAEPVPVERAVSLCPVLRPPRAAALDPGTCDIDAMALHQGYVRGLAARGGRVVSGAPVTAIVRDGDGWSVTAGGELLRADVVVNAAGAWADHVAALAGVPSAGVRPMRRTIAVASGSGPVDPRWPLVSDAADRFYFRPEGERMLVSPADETPSEAVDARPDELDVALALERVNEVTTLGLRRVHTAWAGLRSFAADREPVVGEHPAHPGFVFCAGQGGYGIQMAPALAEMTARVALGDPVDPRVSVTRHLPAAT